MIRGLIPPIAGILSFVAFDTKFSFKKVLALILTVTGVILGCYVELEKEISSGTFTSSGYGILCLVFSAFTQASQHILEE